MAEIRIADITLRESEQAQTIKLSFKEKLEVAKSLEKLQVDIIETGFISDVAVDTAFIRALATTLEYSELCVPVFLCKDNVTTAINTISKAISPRINLIVPTSTIGMEYQYQLKASALLPKIEEVLSHAVSLCKNVEFTADDAVRSDPEFLAEVLRLVIKHGAKTITLCDSAGELLPEELSGFIASVYSTVPELADVTLSLHCKDELGLAAAAVLRGIGLGAREVKVSSGARYKTLSLEQFVNILKIREDTLGISCNLNTTALQRTCSRIASITGNTEITQKPLPGSSETGINDAVLPENATIEHLKNYIESIGYDVSEDELQRIFTQYEDIARNKKIVARDIEALVAENAGQAPPVYKLKSFVINSGTKISATAFVELTYNNSDITSFSAGDGPIDAAIKAVEQIIGTHYELEGFQIQAVTGGREAMGDALIKLRHNGKLFIGRGVSTDIVSAGIRAYLSAINKIINNA
ncbi:MAG: hypothetical protein LBC71_03765 [Oscillospiraceae bacterium]|jgi:2-isopropylmalate synthase|nr:hypothetical protein [Oscillospiraceae bacterium]